MKRLIFALMVIPAFCGAQSKKSPGLSLTELNSFAGEDGRNYRPADTISFADNSRHAIKRINKYELDDGHTIVVYAKTTDGYYVPLQSNTTLANNAVEIQTTERRVVKNAKPKAEDEQAAALANVAVPAEKPTAVNAYKPKEYTAGNGVVYKVGGLVGIGKGSASNGDFLFLNSIGWSAALSGGMNMDRFRAKSHMADYKLEIKAIKEIVYKNGRKVIFVVGGGNVADYELDIDEAINCCEVKSCDAVIAQSLTRLRKMKADGKISESEFQKEKAQLLKR